MRVMVVDDSLVIREGLNRLLEEAGLEGAPGAAEAVVQPDVVVLDLRVPPVADGGRAAARRPDDPLQRLTERESEVLTLMAEGLSDRGIADRLHVSLNTVATHVRHIFLKLELPEGTAANRRVLAVLAVLQPA